MTDRSKFLGGSDAGAVLGLSPWRTPLAVYLEKTEQAPPETIDPGRAVALRRGTRLEPYIVDMLAEEHGVTIAKRNERYVDPTIGYLAAEIDAETDDGRNVEIKSVSPWKAKEWGEPGTDSIPVHYTAQVMHGLMVRPAEETIVAALIGTDDFRVFRVRPDLELITALREREVKFWTDHVLARVPPEPIDADDARLRWPVDTLDAIEADEETVALVTDLRDAKARAKAAEEDIKRLDPLVRFAFRDASALMHDGRALATYKAQQSRRFDQAAFSAAHPDLFEQFKSTSSTRVLRIK